MLQQIECLRQIRCSYLAQDRELPLMAHEALQDLLALFHRKRGELPCCPQRQRSVGATFGDVGQIVLIHRVVETAVAIEHRCSRHNELRTAALSNLAGSRPSRARLYKTSSRENHWLLLIGD